MSLGTTNEMQRLCEVAKQHEREKPTPAPSTPLLVTNTIDALIAAAEAEPEPEVERQPKRAICPILCGNGWPERYVTEQGEPTGGEWLAAFSLASPIVEAGGILVLYGKRGTGKTRMASELARAGRYPFDQTRGKKIEGNADPRRTAVYRTAMRFFLQLRATFKKDSKASELDVIDALTEPGLLVLDELQERGDTPFEDRCLTALLDARYGAMRPTIVIANLSKAELGAALGPSIADRAHENGKSIDFNWESYRRK